MNPHKIKKEMDFMRMKIDMAMMIPESCFPKESFSSVVNVQYSMGLIGEEDLPDVAIYIVNAIEKERSRRGGIDWGDHGQDD